ncbi:tyrosine-type recombinase/integrase [Nocardia testacea]|uniref:tyrosine-type recombinase/integrase n=1 Tax=Nocardia testacea TaxID=248551 RepID=UPI000303545F|nr:tyrosine-type recombinase/integrase [Nocardia testacea]
MASFEQYTNKAGQKFWRVQYRNPAGKLTGKRGFKTKRDAKNWADENEHAMKTGGYVAPSASRVKFSEFAENWFAGKVNLAQSTRSRYRGVLDTHLIPEFGTAALGDISHEWIQGWIARSVAQPDTQPTGKKAAKPAGKTVKPATVRKNITVLNQILTEAVKRRRIAVNPAADVELPKAEHIEKRYLAAAQVPALARAASVLTADPKKVGQGRYTSLARAAEGRGVLVYVLAYCGLRFGEAAALRVTDVNVLRSRLRIHRSVTQVNGHMVFSAPKNGKARDVVMPKFVAEMVKKQIDGRGPDELVFPAANGEPLRLRNVRRDWWNRAVKDSGVPAGFTPHELRHTAASLAIRAGASIKVLQRMLGHASAALTLDRYGHLFEDELDGVADRLDAHHSAECSQDVVTGLKLVK